MSDLNKFLAERGKIPIPSGDVAKVKLLAKELALGVHRNLWPLLIHTRQSESREDFVPADRRLKDYLEERWGDIHISPHFPCLQGHGYVEKPNDIYQLSKAAFALLYETEPYNIFISYKRSESSAFALLVLARLKEHGLVPFVDMALEAGENWHADLKERIKACDYFIILLGKETLASDMTVREIGWAIQYKKTIIPVWHSGFDPNSDKWKDIDCKVKEAIQQTNAIRVTDESASGYNTVIVELLNRFDITP